ncbi:chromosome transmission fidelity protein 18 [Aspergillus bombycis]|uniref:Chromosome transmission fidelity protein 18 n=1 Tax=Aspergillus bombycis TaxID=109264 RepID=A0A1F8AHD1_9EURO|nr:chromosome transmission fidelity protein 18 [Aspergillus bombycis]OGM50829.1 chromosome transmission fidelity protein 18 [Aspergillus bombycis]
MTSPPSSFPPSFDPAIHLHSQGPDDIDILPLSESFSDDFEAIHLQRRENIRNKVVILDRAWNLSDVFRSDEDIRPETPTKPSRKSQLGTVDSPVRPLVLLPSSPPVVKMPFISSPVAFPSSAPSPTDPQKRKNGEESQSEEPKRQKIMGGFLDDDDDEDEMDAFGDAHLRSQFEIQDQIIEQPPVAPTEPVNLSQLAQTSTSTLDSLHSPATAPITSVPTSFSLPRREPLSIQITTCSGKTHNVALRKTAAPVSYERLVAGRSTTAPGRAQKSYYGIDIHRLMDEAAQEVEQSKTSRPPPVPAVRQSIEAAEGNQKDRKAATIMWTEKYRARKFTELIGDERTHRSVMRWLKGWESIVYPNLARSNPKKPNNEEERPHRKVMLLCGPPGLGKTTLAHVCAKQAGYEVLEINASDDRSKDVVKGRIRDALGTENVKGMNVEVGEKKVRKAARPVCVVVDEVDGVVGGSGGGGEGGFMKALIDLVLLDQKNASRSSEQNTAGRKRKGDNFRFLRPLILVCNDVYHPSLRPLRASSVAEMIHVRQAPLENVVSRMRGIFNLEGIPADNDGVRRLCEASWGVARRKQANSKNSGTAEGDIRSVLVAAEWVAHKLKYESVESMRLTRRWLEQNVLSEAAGGNSFFKGLNRGGVRDIVDRVFTQGAGFADVPINAESFRDPFDDNAKTPVGVADLKKRHAINRLREMVDASGDYDRCVTECFTSYPLQTYQDDTFLSKPNNAYDWLHFHDTISSKVFSNQDWELTPYLSQSVVAFHHLFASAYGKRTRNELNEEEEEEHPFSGPRAEFAAHEALKQNRAIVNGFQSSLAAPMLRLFRATDCLVTDLVPNLMRMLSPDVKPVVVRGSGEQKSTASVRKESERALVQAAVRVMAGLGVTFEKVRVEGEGGAYGGWAYRMEPPLDSLVTFSKTKGHSSSSGTTSAAPVRYAVRQVLDQEYRKETVRKQTEALSSTTGPNTSARKSADGQAQDDGRGVKRSGREAGVKRDFFGRIIREPSPQPGSSHENPAQNEASKAGRKVWVTYHDGFSNAVRKPISMSELLAGL